MFNFKHFHSLHKHLFVTEFDLLCSANKYLYSSRKVVLKITYLLFQSISVKNRF